MKRARIIPQGIGSVRLILGLVLLVVIGGVGFYIQHQNSNSKQILSAQRPSNSSPQPITAPNPTPTFDIAAFYDKIQTSMTPDEIITLAGKQPDHCVGTDSIPASQNCFWYSGNKTVNVSYGNKNAVQAKSKSGF